jgi:IS5 family transposase
LQAFRISKEKPCNMMSKSESFQSHSEGVALEVLLDKHHPLYRLANSINWKHLNEAFGEYYVENNGRPGIPIRVIAGLHYLKYLENESDESVVEKFCENPYWQYFCGMKTFVHQLPCHPTSLGKWRQRIGETGVEKLLSETLNIAKREKLLTPKQAKRVNVDTTVQEKAITFPTDAKLYFKMLTKLVKAAKAREIALRQTYVRVSKRSLFKHHRYRQAEQGKRAAKELKKLKGYCGRVLREINRKQPEQDVMLRTLTLQAEQLLAQKKEDKNKLYSLHAPEVECIAKGKAHKKYEFGCKVALVTTAKDPWVTAIQAVHGNPYDGALLKQSLAKSEALTQFKIQDAFVDKGFRGKAHHPEDINIVVAGTKRITLTLKKLLRARAGIEPVIGHLKSDHKLERNHLLGKAGDCINAIMTGTAFNMKKLINYYKAERVNSLATAYC